LNALVALLPRALGQPPLYWGAALFVAATNLFWAILFGRRN